MGMQIGGMPMTITNKLINKILIHNHATETWTDTRFMCPRDPLFVYVYGKRRYISRAPGFQSTTEEKLLTDGFKRSHRMERTNS